MEAKGAAAEMEAASTTEEQAAEMEAASTIEELAAEIEAGLQHSRA